MFDAIKTQAEVAKQKASVLSKQTFEKLEEGRQSILNTSTGTAGETVESKSPLPESEGNSLLANARNSVTTISNSAKTSLMSLAAATGIADASAKDHGSAKEDNKAVGETGMLAAAKQKASEARKKAQGVLPMTQNDLNNKTDGEVGEQGGLMNDGITCGLTYKQRLQGAIACYAISGILNFIASTFLHGRRRSTSTFGILYFLGNVIALGSSAFLVGPRKQAKVMCQPVRRVACTVWLTCMVMVLIGGFTLPQKLSFFILLLVFVQYLAMLWYGASYVPYGRTVLKKVAQKCASSARSSVT